MSSAHTTGPPGRGPGLLHQLFCLNRSSTVTPDSGGSVVPVAAGSQDLGGAYRQAARTRVARSGFEAVPSVPRPRINSTLPVGGRPLRPLQPRAPTAPKPTRQEHQGDSRWHASSDQRGNLPLCTRDVLRSLGLSDKGGRQFVQPGLRVEDRLRTGSDPGLLPVDASHWSTAISAATAPAATAGGRSVSASGDATRGARADGDVLKCLSKLDLVYLPRHLSDALVTLNESAQL